MDLNPFFNQYLRDTRIPTLEYFFKNNALGYRWTNSVMGFNMPIKVMLNGKEQLLKPTSDWSTLAAVSSQPSLTVDSNFYVASINITD